MCSVVKSRIVSSEWPTQTCASICYFSTNRTDIFSKDVAQERDTATLEPFYFAAMFHALCYGQGFPLHVIAPSDIDNPDAKKISKSFSPFTGLLMMNCAQESV